MPLGSLLSAAKGALGSVGGWVKGALGKVSDALKQGIGAAVGQSVGDLAGDFLGGTPVTEKQWEKNFQWQKEQAKLNRFDQYEFAKKGIQMKVEDALLAGIHPLAALGAQTIAAQPVYTGADPGAPTQSLGDKTADAMLQMWVINQKEDANKKRLEQEILKERVIQARQTTYMRGLESNRRAEEYFSGKEADKKQAKGTRENPEPLFRYYRDPYTGKIIPSAHPDFAEGGEGFLGSKAFIYGQTQDPVWR